MADEKEKDVKKEKDTEKEKTDKKASGIPLLHWIIMAVVVIVCAGAGFGLGRLFGGSGTPEAAESAQQDGSAQTQGQEADGSATGSQENWYYDLDPVVACLDEPGVRRYVRTAFRLAMSPQLSPKKGTDFLNNKKPLLRNWLTIFLASLSLEDVRGDKNLKRIQLEVLDAFNEKLWPDAKPQIVEVLYNEFAIQ